MRQLLHIVFWCLTLVAATSCAEKYHAQDGSPSGDGYFAMSINAYLDAAPQAKTSYSGRKVYWESTDAVSVFFDARPDARQRFTIAECSDDNSVAVFKGLGVRGSYVAVYPDSESNSYDGEELRVCIPSEQTAVLNGFASGANVAVASSKENTLVFRNVGSLIGFRFSSQDDADQIKSVTFRAKSKVAFNGRYVGLTGSAVVAHMRHVCDGVTDFIPTAGSGNEDHVTVHAPSEGFVAGTGMTYYAVVYPFECDGFEVVFTASDGGTRLVQSDSHGACVRNEGLALNALPSLSEIPSAFTFELDFSNNVWPFTTACKLPEDQTEEGETYTYRYTNQAYGYSKDYDFVISKGASSKYLFGPMNNTDHSILAPSIGAEGGWIKLPAIPDRYLKSVTVTHYNTTDKRFTIQNRLTGDVAKYSASKVKAADANEPVETSVVFPATNTLMGNLKTTNANQSYYIYFGNAGDGICVGKIRIVYTDTKP